VRQHILFPAAKIRNIAQRGVRTSGLRTYRWLLYSTCFFWGGGFFGKSHMTGGLAITEIKLLPHHPIDQYSIICNSYIHLNSNNTPSFESAIPSRAAKYKSYCPVGLMGILLTVWTVTEPESFLWLGFRKPFPWNCSSRSNFELPELPHHCEDWCENESCESLHRQLCSRCCWYIMDCAFVST
jgi:hypothetical protein